MYTGKKSAAQEVHDAKAPLDSIVQRLRKQYNSEPKLTKTEQKAILDAAKLIVEAEERLTRAREILEVF